MQSHNHCDQDWVWFSGTAGRTYRIETSNLSFTSDTTLSLELGCSGVPLATNDDAIPGVTLASKIDFTPAQAGNYDVVVEQYLNNGYDEGDSYDVRVLDITGLFFEDGFESGDTQAWSATVP